MGCCVLWCLALQSTHPKSTNLTCLEFLLTNNVLDIHGHRCSFKAKQPLAPKFFLASGLGLGSFEGHVDYCELSIQSIWGKVPKDWAIGFSPSLAKHIAIVAEWVKSHAGNVRSKILLSKENI